MVIPENFDKFRLEAKKKRKQNNRFFERLRKEKPGPLHDRFLKEHEKVFACTDCLKCANCCKTTGPLFTQKDIERIASHLKLKPGTFVEKYLRIDEDQDYVLQQVPCVFLGEDNYCSIYEHRPKACREYPHTDSPKIQQLLKITAKNLEICPAVEEIVESLKLIY